MRVFATEVAIPPNSLCFDLQMATFSCAVSWWSQGKCVFPALGAMPGLVFMFYMLVSVYLDHVSVFM